MKGTNRACVLALVAGLTCSSLAAAPAGAKARKKSSRGFRPHVVVATLDTGSNIFHPTWRRPEIRHPSTYIPGYPKDAEAVSLSFGRDYGTNVAASATELERFKKDEFPYWMPGTNLIGTWAHPSDDKPIFDSQAPQGSGGFPLGEPSHSHGARASSQIAGAGFSLAPEAYLVIADTDPDGPARVEPYKVNALALRWAADQPWIDIIHTNIQNPIPLANEDIPLFAGYADAVAYALSKGKVVVSAAGNFYGLPTETSPHAGPPGVLAAGANDNCGYAAFTNPDPHVVMDGGSTVAAAAASDGEESFGGTSSSSPRTTGYVAQLLLELRRKYDYRGGIQARSLIVVPASRAPARGPLRDGRLTAAELHEVVRKTADPNPHESKYDGLDSVECIPQPVDLPVAFYPKMGYGEVSEHTIDSALKVLTGDIEMPERPVEDIFYDASEALRREFWP